MNRMDTGTGTTTGCVKKTITYKHRFLILWIIIGPFQGKWIYLLWNNTLAVVSHLIPAAVHHCLSNSGCLTPCQWSSGTNLHGVLDLARQCCLVEVWQTFTSTGLVSVYLWTLSMHLVGLSLWNTPTVASASCWQASLWDAVQMRKWYILHQLDSGEVGEI